MNPRAEAGSGSSARPPRASVLAVAAMLVATLVGAVVTDRLVARSHDRDEAGRADDAGQRVQGAAQEALDATSSMAGLVALPNGSRPFSTYARAVIRRADAGTAAVLVAVVQPRHLAAVARELKLHPGRIRATRSGGTSVYRVVLTSWNAGPLRAGSDATSDPTLGRALASSTAALAETVAAGPGGLWVVQALKKALTPMTDIPYVAVYYPVQALLKTDAGQLDVSVDGSPLQTSKPRTGAGRRFTEAGVLWRIVVPPRALSLADRLLPVAVLIVGSAFALLVWMALGRLLRRQTAALTLERRRSERRVLAERVADEERRRIARDLHDSISQGLFSMQLQARTAAVALERDGVKNDSALWRSVHELGRLTRGALAEIRALIFELRPEGLREEGLVAALDKHAAAVAARHELNVEVDLPSTPLPLDPLVEEELYRLAQEAIHNAVRHSSAQVVKVSAGTDPVRGVWLEVADDGVGFDPTIHRPGHLGLRTMAERAARAGGDLVIESSPGEGTRVRLSLPLVTA